MMYMLKDGFSRLVEHFDREVPESNNYDADNGNRVSGGGKRSSIKIDNSQGMIVSPSGPVTIGNITQNYVIFCPSCNTEEMTRIGIGKFTWQCRHCGIINEEGSKQT